MHCPPEAHYEDEYCSGKQDVPENYMPSAGNLPQAALFSVPVIEHAIKLQHFDAITCFCILQPISEE